MVRLLLAKQDCMAIAHHMFQSHNGAIATTAFSQHDEAVAQVSIPQWCDCYRLRLPSVAEVEHCFNPTMVRLLPPYLFPSADTESCFNPTMVRLLLDAYAVELTKYLSFNPTMVRLLPFL